MKLIQEKGKQNWGWVEKNVAYKKAVYFKNIFRFKSEEKSKKLIQEKGKQNWGWVEKNVAYKKAVYFKNIFRFRSEEKSKYWGKVKTKAFLRLCVFRDDEEFRKYQGMNTETYQVLIPYFI